MMGRTIFSRHRRYGFYRPSAVTVAMTFADLPNNAAQIMVFSVSYYIPRSDSDQDLTSFDATDHPVLHGRLGSQRRRFLYRKSRRSITLSSSRDTDVSLTCRSSFT